MTLLNWTVTLLTLLHCDFTELWLYWTVTLLRCCSYIGSFWAKLPLTIKSNRTQHKIGFQVGCAKILNVAHHLHQGIRDHHGFHHCFALLLQAHGPPMACTRFLTVLKGEMLGYCWDIDITPNLSKKRWKRPSRITVQVFVPMSPNRLQRHLSITGASFRSCHRVIVVPPTAFPACSGSLAEVWFLKTLHRGSTGGQLWFDSFGVSDEERSFSLLRDWETPETAYIQSKSNRTQHKIEIYYIHSTIPESCAAAHPNWSARYRLLWGASSLQAHHPRPPQCSTHRNDMLQAWKPPIFKSLTTLPMFWLKYITSMKQRNPVNHLGCIKP